MKSCALLSSYLLSVIDRSKLSPSREALYLYFYSNNDPTSPMGPGKKNRQQNRFLERRLSERSSYNWWHGKLWLSGNNAQFVSVDLIWEKNQVILEYVIILAFFNKNVL